MVRAFRIEARRGGRASNGSAFEIGTSRDALPAGLQGAFPEN
jgi:hypothetical protein